MRQPQWYELLRVLTQGARRVLTHEALLRQVWAGRNIDDPKIVRAYVKRLRNRLSDDAARPAWIFNERGVGYRMARPGDPGEPWQPRPPTHRRPQPRPRCPGTSSSSASARARVGNGCVEPSTSGRPHALPSARVPSGQVVIVATPWDAALVGRCSRASTSESSAAAPSPELAAATANDEPLDPAAGADGRDEECKALPSACRPGGAERTRAAERALAGCYWVSEGLTL